MEFPLFSSESTFISELYTYLVKYILVELLCVERADGLLRNMRVFESYGYIKLKATQNRPNIDFKLSKEAM